MFLSVLATVDHLQIMLCCLNPTFMANDVCFILIKRRLRVNIHFSIYFPPITTRDRESLKEIECEGARMVSGARLGPAVFSGGPLRT